MKNEESAPPNLPGGEATKERIIKEK